MEEESPALPQSPLQPLVASQQGGEMGPLTAAQCRWNREEEGRNLMQGASPPTNCTSGQHTGTPVCTSGQHTGTQGRACNGSSSSFGEWKTAIVRRKKGKVLCHLRSQPPPTAGIPHGKEKRPPPSLPQTPPVLLLEEGRRRRKTKPLCVSCDLEQEEPKNFYRGKRDWEQAAAGREGNGGVAGEGERKLKIV